MQIREFQKEAGKNSRDHGWWSNWPVDKSHQAAWVNSKLMLAVTELAEAADELRNAQVEDLRAVYYEGEKPRGFGVELADACIRIFDLAEFLGIDLEEILLKKHEYNKSREWRHGNKLV